MTRKTLYEGKAKILFEGPEEGTIIQYFKDDATAYNAQKKRYNFTKRCLEQSN